MSILAKLYDDVAAIRKGAPGHTPQMSNVKVKGGTEAVFVGVFSVCAVHMTYKIKSVLRICYQRSR